MILAELKQLCLKFDAEKGTYPEDEFEGAALFEFFLQEINLSDDDFQKEVNQYEEERGNQYEKNHTKN